MNTPNTWTTRTAIALSTAALAAGLTACGSGNDSPSGRADGKPAASPSVSAPSVTQAPLSAPADALEQKSGGNIRQGADGFRVSCVQWGLNTFNPRSYRLAVDGIFGPQTARAVRKYQADRRLSADGIVGPRTAGRLRTDMRNLIVAIRRTGESTTAYSTWLTNCSSQLPS